MPTPIALASKEEEDRRAWVTAHHEVVRLVKDCFGDRFSNNEIFDRLKISRRTGYRALSNDERIGKAPGRKPKIADNTIKEMIDYIENGGCNDVGNVWKHLSEKFAPDCNPKTVQDAVKKSGFKNYRSTVKLEPLLNEQIPDGDGSTNVDEQTQQMHQAQQAQQVVQDQQQQQAQQQQQTQTQQSVIDPAFQQPSVADGLRTAIESAPDGHVRYALYELCLRSQEAVQVSTAVLFPYISQPTTNPLAPMTMSPQLAQQLQQQSQGQFTRVENTPGKRARLAICRRCNEQYDRAENTMENRNCLYHKGSPQKIFPEGTDSIEQSPEAYIWSCCGGNGLVRGCCRAMHTTKKKRKYGKKRTADDAGLDGANDGNDNNDDGGDSDGDDGETTLMTAADAARQFSPVLESGSTHGHNFGQQNQSHASTLQQLASSANDTHDPNIDASLQDFAAAAAAHHAQQHHSATASDMAVAQHQLSMQMAAQMAGQTPEQSMQGFSGLSGSLGDTHGLQSVGLSQGLHDGTLGGHENAGLTAEVQAQLQLAAGMMSGN